MLHISNCRNIRPLPSDVSGGTMLHAPDQEMTPSFITLLPPPESTGSCRQIQIYVLNIAATPEHLLSEKATAVASQFGPFGLVA